MAAPEAAPQFGAELKDGFKPVNVWVSNGISWLDEIQSFYRERSAIEKEYSQKLSALAAKYYDKKAKRSSSLSVGDTPAVTPGSLESASMTTWGVQLSTLEARAAEHDRFSTELNSVLSEPLKQLGVKLDGLRKHHAEYASKLEKERDGSYADLRKTKGKYDGVCQEVENKRRKQGSAMDHGKAKANTAFNQQQEEMRNVKNTYLIAINVTNKQKERYYNDYIPEILDSLQDLSETRTVNLNALWLKAAAIEQNILAQSTKHVEHLSSEIPRNQPHLDSLMFVQHNAVDWYPPADFVFEPSPVWLDDAEMAVDPTSQIFLRNILTKSKASLTDLRREVDNKRREVEAAKRVRGLIREGKDKRDEASVLQSQFTLQEILHESERKKITAEVEVATISRVVGDVSASARAHAFKAQTFKIPTNCDLCGERIWGLSAKGFDCKDCGFTCHSKCEMKVPAECPGEVDKAEMKKLKAQRQVDAQNAQGMAALSANGDAADGPRLTRSSTIGSMSTLSSGYAASAHRNASGTLGPENGESKPLPAAPAARKNRIIAPPPTSYVGDAPRARAGSDATSGYEERGRMLYAYQANGSGELSVDEDDKIVVVEADDGSGWTKIRSTATGETGVVPTSYIDVVPSEGPSTPFADPTPVPLHQKKKGPAVAPRRAGKKTAPDGRQVEALYDYTAAGDGETDMSAGERMLVVAPDAGDGWIEVERASGGRGVVPAGWVKDV